MGLFTKTSDDRRSFGDDADIKVRKPAAKPGPSLFLLFILLMLWTVLVVVVASLGFSFGAKHGQENADRHLFGRESPWFLGSKDRLLQPTAVSTSEDVFEAWTKEVKQRIVIERKINSISLADSLIGDPSDHIFLGVYEQHALNRKSEAALHFYIALSNGHPDAYRLYNALNIQNAEYNALYQRFIAIHELNGDEGLERLGQFYLGKDVFAIAKRMRTQLRFGEPNDYVWPRQEEAENLAYIHFQMASICGLPSAYEWRQEVASFYRFTAAREQSLKVRANSQLKELSERYSRRRRGVSGQDAYCKREHLDNLFATLIEEYTDRATVRFQDDLETDRQLHPCEEENHDYSDDECDEFDEYIEGDGGFKYRFDVPTFRDLIEEVGRGGRRSSGGSGRSSGGPIGAIGGGGIGGGGRDSASPLYRQGPGGSVGGDSILDYEYQQFEHDCLEPDNPDQDEVTDQGYRDCVDEYRDRFAAEERRLEQAACNDRAKRFFNLGEADMAIGRIPNARRRFNQAISTGRACQSEYAFLAGRRVAALNLTCEYTPNSLSRISRGYYNNPEGGAIIDLPSRQRALRAKGYYNGPIDGKYGQPTREAVRKFQREFGFNETGDLTPIETVYLICSAAETHSDLKSINTLGIMYIAGLGVVQNTDRGLDWLRFAADSGNEDAMFNLALIYGTGTVVSSYRICGNVENIARADSWLEQAAKGGHLPALNYVRRFGPLPPSERWTEIRKELELNDFYLDRLETVGEACAPNR